VVEVADGVWGLIAAGVARCGVLPPQTVYADRPSCTRRKGRCAIVKGRDVTNGERSSA
jgi:hypothetical protein